MTVKALRTPPSTELFGIVWIGASNEIAHSALASNGTIPQSRGKNNRDFDLAQTDIDYCTRLDEASLGWDSTPVEGPGDPVPWDDGQLWGGEIGGVRQLHLSPALICAADLVDLGLAVAVIHNAEGGAGINNYANVAGTSAKTFFDSRISDAPATFVMRALCMGMGFPDMGNETDANNVQANLDTIVNRYRDDSSINGAGSFHAFLFAHHSDFSGEPFYDTVVTQSQSWAASDPRNHYVPTQSITQLDRTVVSVAAPSFGNHWGPEDTADRGGVMARAIFNALAGV